MLDQITGAEKYYFSALGEGRFLIQSCEDCDKHVFYPRQLCPHCHSLNLSWIEPAGGATVYSTSVVRRKGEDGGDYNVAIVELDEGVRMMSNFLDFDMKQQDARDAWLTHITRVVSDFLVQR